MKVTIARALAEGKDQQGTEGRASVGGALYRVDGANREYIDGEVLKRAANIEQHGRLLAETLSRAFSSAMPLHAPSAAKALAAAAGPSDIRPAPEAAQAEREW